MVIVFAGRARGRNAVTQLGKENKGWKEYSFNKLLLSVDYLLDLFPGLRIQQ